IPEMLQLIHTFRDHKDFQTRLAGRNETFKNRYAYQLDIRKKLTNEVNRDRYGIPILDREAYNRHIDAVTSASAGAVIDKVFDPDNLTMVFYGDAGRISGILSKLTPSVTMSVL